MPTEQELKNALDEMSPQSIRSARPVGEVRGVAHRRVRRHRIIAGVGAAVLCVGVVVGAQALLEPNEVVVAAGTDAASNEQVADETTVSTTVGSTTTTTAEASEVAETDQVDDQSPTTSVDPPSKSLESERQLAVASTDSPVAFAGASGVFAEPVPNGFVVVAGRFGSNGIEPVVMTTTNGKDWDSFTPSGIRSGASFVALDRSDVGFVGLISWFDVEREELKSAIVSSPDARNWSVEVLLDDGALMPEKLALSGDRIVVMAAGPRPTYWVGTLGGAFERVGYLDTSGVETLNAMPEGFFATLTVDGEFKVWESIDGVDWQQEAESRIVDRLGRSFVSSTDGIEL